MPAPCSNLSGANAFVRQVGKALNERLEVVDRRTWLLGQFEVSSDEPNGTAHALGLVGHFGQLTFNVLQELVDLAPRRSLLVVAQESVPEPRHSAMHPFASVLSDRISLRASDKGKQLLEVLEDRCAQLGGGVTLQHIESGSRKAHLVEPKSTRQLRTNRGGARSSFID